MLKSSLIEILRTFTKDDLAKFDDFAGSPYHNKNSNAVKLYAAMKKFAPQFESSHLGKEEMWKKIYPGKKYNYGIMKNLIHDLTKLSENYLSYESFSAGLDQSRYLTKELFARQCFGVFNDRLKKFESKNESKLSDSTDYFLNKVLINDRKTNYLEKNSLKPGDSPGDLNDLIMYFADAIFEFGRMMYMQRQTANLNYDFSFIEYIVNYFEKKPALLEKSLFVKFKYYGLLYHMRDQDGDMLKEQLGIFEELKDNLSPADKYLAYQQIYWALEMMSRKQVKNYERLLIDHMIEMVERNIYSGTGGKYVPLNLFTNIIFVCARNLEGAILKKFIDKNINKVAPGIRESMKIYSYGNISFLEKDYEKALYYFSKTDHSFSESSKDNYYFKYGAKLLILVSNYELNNLEQTLTEIDSFGHFLNNNILIHDQIRPRGINFAKTLKELTLLNLNRDEVKLNKLITKIENFDNSLLSRKSWLLEKTRELKIK